MGRRRSVPHETNHKGHVGEGKHHKRQQERQHQLIHHPEILDERIIFEISKMSGGRNNVVQNK